MAHNPPIIIIIQAKGGFSGGNVESILFLKGPIAAKIRQQINMTPIMTKLIGGLYN